MLTFGLFAAISAAGWILLIVGIAIQRYQSLRQEQERTRATGTVVAHAGGTGRGRYCMPVIEFTADGQKIRQRCKGTFEREKYPVGQTLDILYDADAPTRFHPDAAVEVNPGRILVLIGVAWIAFAVILTGLLSGVLERHPGAGKNTFPLSDMPKVSTVKGDSQGSTDGFQYLLSDFGTALLKGYSGSESDVSLPMLIEGHLVTGMTQAAFSGNRRMTRVQVPGTVRALSNGAFAGCIALREVVLSEGVQVINAMAFAIYRILEKKVGEKYTCEQLIDTMRDMIMERPGNGQGYIPIYTRTKITDALHETAGFRTDYEILTDISMKKVIRLSKGKKK